MTEKHLNKLVPKSRNKRAFIFVFSFILILAAFTLTDLPVKAQGVDLGDFVRAGIGGRPLAMSGAYVAVGGNSSTAFWNPATITEINGYNLGGMYTDRFSAGIIYQYISGSGTFEFEESQTSSEQRSPENSGFFSSISAHNPIKGKLGFGLNRIGMDLGDVSYANDPVGEARSLWLGSVGYGFPNGSIVDGLSIGASLKRYRRQLNEDSVSGWGYDLGLRYAKAIDPGGIPITGAVGFNLQDPGGVEMGAGDGVDIETTGVIPPYNRVGVAVQIRTTVPVTVGAGYDFSPTRPQLNRMNFGSEISFADLFHLRGGINKWLREEGFGFSFGAGVDIGFFKVNYAYLPHNLGSTHIISSDFTF